MHVHHETLEGYDPAQILHDGCEECEQRGAQVGLALASMDGDTFERAWRRGYDNRATRGTWDGSRVSDAESDVLDALWAVQLHLERNGFALDGQVPHVQDCSCRQYNEREIHDGSD